MNDSYQEQHELFRSLIQPKGQLHAPKMRANRPLVNAAVFVCDAWLTFTSKHDSDQWAVAVLRELYPHGFTLQAEAPLEVVVGYQAAEAEAFTNMAERLTHILEQTTLAANTVRLKQHRLQVSQQTMTILAVTAVSIPSAKISG